MTLLVSAAGSPITIFWVLILFIGERKRFSLRRTLNSGACELSEGETELSTHEEDPLVLS